MSKHHDKNEEQAKAAGQPQEETPEIEEVLDTEENESQATEETLDENARLQNELDAARAEIEKD